MRKLHSLVWTSIRTMLKDAVGVKHCRRQLGKIKRARYLKRSRYTLPSLCSMPTCSDSHPVGSRAIRQLCPESARQNTWMGINDLQPRLCNCDVSNLIFLSQPPLSHLASPMSRLDGSTSLFRLLLDRQKSGIEHGLLHSPLSHST